VKALTGVDTIAGRKKKRRGSRSISASLPPASRRHPGKRCGCSRHEAFVKNMLAGATGIDVALSIIAADEGIMHPQTEEHLAIVELLGGAARHPRLTNRDS